MSSGYVIASVTVTNPTQYEEYRKARAAREGAAIMRMVCVEGL